jgi:arabinose-5-phosphate isomerase
MVSVSGNDRQQRLLADARATLDTEIAGLRALSDGLDKSFAAAVDVVLSLTGHLVVTGIGKSGHIGAKIAATLASTGQPSFFLHPSEASHGDLGMLATGCGLLAISYSGESRELRDSLLFARRAGYPVIGITRNPHSTLGRLSSVVLRLPSMPEACPNGLAPTTSTTMTLALGDALAVAVMGARGFSSEEFGLRHPGGKLGLQLQRVSDFLSLQPKEELPLVATYAPTRIVLSVVSGGRKGCAGVVNADGALVGMITDGDLRRAIDDQFFDKNAASIMTPMPFSLSSEMRMSEVLSAFAARRISNAFVLDNHKPVGLVDFKDLAAGGYL